MRDRLSVSSKIMNGFGAVYAPRCERFLSASRILRASSKTCFMKTDPGKDAARASPILGATCMSLIGEQGTDVFLQLISVF